MLLLGSSHWQDQVRQVELAERMLVRRVDALLMCPRPVEDLRAFVASTLQTGTPPLVFVDNYLTNCPAGRVLSDNRWGARQAVCEMLNRGEGGSSSWAETRRSPLSRIDIVDTVTH